MWCNEPSWSHEPKQSSQICFCQVFCPQDELRSDVTHSHPWAAVCESAQSKGVIASKYKHCAAFWANRKCLRPKDHMITCLVNSSSLPPSLSPSRIFPPQPWWSLRIPVDFRNRFHVYRPLCEDWDLFWQPVVPKFQVCWDPDGQSWLSRGNGFDLSVGFQLQHTLEWTICDEEMSDRRDK